MSSYQSLFAAVLDVTSVKPEVKTWMQNLLLPGLLQGFTTVPNLTSPHPQPSQKSTSFPPVPLHHQVPELWGVHHSNTVCISKAYAAKASFWNPCSLRGHQGFTQILGFPRQLHIFNCFRFPTLWLKARVTSFFTIKQGRRHVFQDLVLKKYNTPFHLQEPTAF